MAKCRVAPLGGLTAPRSEMKGLLAGVKVADVLLRALKEKPSNVTFLLDSTCVIAAMRSKHGIVTAYLANRKNEINETLGDWRVKYPDVVISPFLHIPGSLNIADMGTRDKVKWEEIGENSRWDRGYSFMETEREDWPISENVEGQIPDKELVKAVRASSVKINAISKRIVLANKDDPEPVERPLALLSALKGILEYSNSILKVRGIFGRVLRLSRLLNSKSKEGIIGNMKEKVNASLRQPFTLDDYKAADCVMLLLSQPAVKRLLNSPPPVTSKKGSSGRKIKRGVSLGKGKMNMASLAPFMVDGIYYTRGRFGGQLKRVLGPDKLPILPATCRLAHLFMTQAHELTHSAGGETCFKSRVKCWITRARPLADAIAENCYHCKREFKEYQQQQMGGYPSEKLVFPCKPWTSMGLDFLGGYKVKAMKNARSYLTVYPVVYGCHVTGSLHSELAWSYGTDTFLITFAAFTAVRGRPAKLYTDRGTQLVKAGDYLDPAEWDWDEINRTATMNETSIRYCPAGSQWRNGISE